MPDGRRAGAARCGCGGAVVFAAGFAEAPDGAALQARARAPRPPPRPAGVRAQRQRDRRAARPRRAVGRHGRAAPSPARSRSSRRAATSRSTRWPRGAGCGCTPSSRAATRRVLDAARLPRRAGRARRRALGRAVPRGRRRRRALVRGAGALRAARASASRCSRRGARAAGAARGRRPTRARSPATSASFRALVRGGRRGLGGRPARAAGAGQGARGRAARARAATAALAVMTCSGGDSGRRRRPRRRARRSSCRRCARDTVARARALLPAAATAANPLDYTALLWDEAETLRALIARARRRPGDRPRARALRPAARASTARCAELGRGARRRSARARRRARCRSLVASTLPELLDDEAAARADRAPAWPPWPACAPRCAARRRSPRRRRPRAPARDRRAARAARDGAGPLARRARGQGAAAPRRASPSRRARGRATRTTRPRSPRGSGGPVALKLVGAGLRHKTERGAVALGLEDERNVRWRLPRPACAADGAHAGDARARRARWRRAGVELLVARARDGVVPVLVVGPGRRLDRGLDDVALVPLPADARARRARAALAARRAAADRRAHRPPVDVAAAAALAARAGDAAARPGLELLELNPVIVHARGAVAVDALVAAPNRRRHMNEIAAKLGEVGLPAPLSELAARDWDAVVVGGGHNGLTAAAYLARAGQRVLVLERRERLGGACTLERPFPDERFVVSPCAYVVGPARRARDPRARPAPARLRVLRRRPQPVGPVRGRHVLRPVARRRAAPSATFETLGVSPRTSRATGPTSTSSTRSARKLRTGARDTWVGETPTRAEIEELLRRRADDARHRLRAPRSPRCSTTT